MNDMNDEPAWDLNPLAHVMTLKAEFRVICHALTQSSHLTTNLVGRLCSPKNFMQGEYISAVITRQYHTKQLNAISANTAIADLTIYCRMDSGNGGNLAC